MKQSKIFKLMGTAVRPVSMRLAVAGIAAAFAVASLLALLALVTLVAKSILEWKLKQAHVLHARSIANQAIASAESQP